ncbi:hypothetical protein PHYSODRAFT_435890, partial [Phytophthora sojae]
MPSRRTITERLETHAQKKRADMEVAIVASAIFYCLTTDIWTSHTTESFLALTIHYVTAAFQMKTCDELGVDHLSCVAHSLHLVVSGALSK